MSTSVEFINLSSSRRKNNIKIFPVNQFDAETKGLRSTRQSKEDCNLTQGYQTTAVELTHHGKLHASVYITNMNTSSNFEHRFLPPVHRGVARPTTQPERVVFPRSVAHESSSSPERFRYLLYLRPQRRTNSVIFQAD